MFERLWNQFDIHMQELFRGASIAFVLKILAAGFGFGLNVVLARLLGADGFGIYNLAFTVIFVVAAVGRVGMENTLVRFIAASISIGKPEKALGVYQKALKYSLLTALILSCLAYILAPIISINIFGKQDLEQPLSVMSLAIVPLALLTLHAYALQGIKKIAASITVLSIGVPFIAGIFAILMVPQFGISAAVWGYLFSTIVTLLVGRWFWVKATLNLTHIEPKFDTQELLSSSLPLFAGVIMNMIIMWSPVLLLGMWESSESVGIFSAASRTAVLTSFILIAVNSIAAPKFAALFQQGDIKTLGLVARESSRIMMLLASSVLFVLVAFPEEVLSIFGDEFKQGALVLMILSIGQFINVATGSVGYLLMMTGNERLMRNNLIFCMFIGLLLSFLLIPLFGIVGAAISSSIILVLQNLIAMALVWYKLKIFTLPLFKAG